VASRGTGAKSNAGGGRKGRRGGQPSSSFRDGCRPGPGRHRVVSPARWKVLKRWMGPPASSSGEVFVSRCGASGFVVASLYGVSGARLESP